MRRRTRATFVVIAGAGLISACSSRPLTGDGGDGASDEARPDTGAPDAAPDAPADVPDTGAPDATPDAPTDVPETGVDGGHCGRVNLGATIVLSLPGARTLSCLSPAPADAGPVMAPVESWVGMVTGSDATSLVVDVCGAGGDDAGAEVSDAGAPDAGCVPSVLRIEAHAPGLDLTRFPRVAVTVRASVGYFYACAQALEITAAAQDGGASGQLLLAVVDGDGLAFAGSPYKVAHAPLGCVGEPVRIGGIPVPSGDDYAFDFSDASGGAALRLYMGETADWTLRGTPYTVRNLRSFVTGNSDDYWNWAYTIYTDPK